MLTASENELLCRVEGDAPMGRLMRRHWVPALLSEQVATPNGAPVRLQLFGEKLVAAEGERAARKDEASFLSDARGRGLRLDLYGAA